MLSNSILMWFVIYWLVSALFVYVNITCFLNTVSEGNEKVIEKFGEADKKEIEKTDYKDTNEFLDYTRETISSTPESVVSSSVLFISLLFGGIYAPSMLLKRIEKVLFNER